MKTWLIARTFGCLVGRHHRCRGEIMGRCPHNGKMVFVDCGCACHHIEGTS